PRLLPSFPTRRSSDLAWTMQDLLANNGVAPGEQMTLAAFRRLAALRRRAHATLDANLERVRAFFARERRLQAFVPEGGNVVFPRDRKSTRLNSSHVAI